MENKVARDEEGLTTKHGRRHSLESEPLGSTPEDSIRFLMLYRGQQGQPIDYAGAELLVLSVLSRSG